MQTTDVGDSRYRRTLDSLIEGFQIIDRDWRYVYVNPSAASQGRSTPDALIGRTMWDAYPGIDQAPFFATLRRCMDSRVPAILENLFTYPDGRQRWFELRVEPVPEGICIHSYDIHERKETETALGKLRAELEARVAARTLALRELNDELEAFSFSVSHDLRAPLRHVVGFVDILIEDCGPKLGDEDREYLVRISRAAKRMTGMIDDLLAFSRLGRAELARQPVELREIVHAARADLEHDAEGREIVWTIGELPVVEGDPSLLQLAIVNLLSNAIKYTRGRSPAVIEIGAHRHAETHEHVVWVRDNGIGFDMRRADRLFGVFQRLHTDQAFEGTGIGLANVRRIIARHGGRAWAESSPDAGSTFSIAFPPSGKRSARETGP